MFSRLGRFVATHWPWVIAAWVISVPLIQFYSPDWSAVSQDDDVKSFPENFDSVRGHELLQRAFPEDVFNSQVVIAIERKDTPLSEADYEFINNTLAVRLSQVGAGGIRRDENGDVIHDEYGLGEFLTPATTGIGNLLKSEDQQAALLIAPCRATYLSTQVIRTVEALREEIGTMEQSDQVPEGLTVKLTGSAGVGADLQVSQTQSMDNSFVVTIILVIGILLVVYRSPVVALIPLVSITVSVVLAMSSMAMLTLVDFFHFQVLKITPLFMIVVLYGAGTDYCLFLIARYREELEAGATRPEAIERAVGNVGAALAASAATVICGLGMMIFADFAKIRYTGPAVAVSLTVALLACLTLTPAMLRMLGPVVFWPLSIKPKKDGEVRLQERIWDSVARGLVRRPTFIWAASVAVLTPFAIWGMNLGETYDYLAELDEGRGSKQGSEIIRSHFAPGALGPLKILVEIEKGDLTTPEAQKHIEQLTQWLNTGESPTRKYYDPASVARVLSLTHPLGSRIAAESAAPSAESPKQSTEQRTGFDIGQLLDGFARQQQDAERLVREQTRKRAIQHYVSSASNGQVTRLEIIFAIDPFAQEAIDLLGSIRELVQDFTAQPNTTLAGAEFSFAGITSTTNDLMKVTQSDQNRIHVLVVLAVFVILFLLLHSMGFFRRVGLGVYLMLTVLLGYYATLGLTELTFHGLHILLHPDTPFLGLDWKVGFFLFIILVAIGQDYNIFLMSRVLEEEKKHGMVDGVRIAVTKTGGIITSCGIIMAGTFGSMMTGTLAAIIQLGFALGLGVLLDTFVVRPILVPAFLLMIRKHGGKSQLSPRQQSADSVDTVADSPLLGEAQAARTGL